MASQDEQDPFIAKGFNSEDDLKYASRPKQHPKTHLIIFIFQVLFFLLNITLFMTTKASNTDCTSCGALNQNVDHSPYSPAHSAIRYKVSQDKYEEGPSPFSGVPRLELDEAWSKLLRSSMIRLSADEMRKMNKTSVMLKDGSGYVGYLEAIHMLHCVKRMHQAQYPEHYPKLQAEDAFSTHHWDHCLEVLRKGIMCNADTTINTYLWQRDSHGKLMIKGNRTGPRKCTDWDKLQEWAEDRTIYGSDRDRFLESLVSPSEHGGGLGPLELGT
ncbi:hypothetical protein QC762_404494 [Podospora pseudocomata]|uniref:DUF3328 domain-containing protein n=1 Tax=Podospora pseudocomata TaxID=2093779 RepID=A0ABR0GH95_9PEZI|nr:hypothetical protein QC762_404494 [Podospora pseudocomata]